MRPHCIGIRREDKNPWERRAPLVPTHVRELIRKQGLAVCVQPSDVRIFSDREIGYPVQVRIDNSIKIGYNSLTWRRRFNGETYWPIRQVVGLPEPLP